MAGQHRWALGLATSTASILGLTVTSGLALVAHFFVQEFSRPHTPIPDSAMDWGMPSVLIEEPPQMAQRSLLFSTADGTLLCGDFWAQPQPAPTVILCHGYRISRSHLRSVAQLEYARGYNVLFFDFRGHGDSESVMTTAGNAEVRDMEAAIFVAGHQPETLPGKIIIHGFSMGAAVALLTPPHPDVVAIIADSPYARSDDILRRLVAFRLVDEWLKRYPRQPLPQLLVTLLAWSIVGMSRIVFRLRYGFTVIARPDTSFKRWKQRSKKILKYHPIPILLIHSSGDNLIPIDHAHQIRAEAAAYGAPLETYFVDAKVHCGAYGWNPLQYDLVIQSFLARHLADALPERHRQL
ncbi:alpha/beta hydrolase [Dictyobacter aurantiacus]|uniref:Alpha/beta hydrolase n=1 Tax=Dictyobacter aurantiacus TaxID=1936993 RepID=A0A401Z856_9CHLR|nr:alpha/beta fold hydrolase [Dictyobacter aurantiacus]GCE03047.1 alpha/beta hydrolase [Dictyobacter aurantiacus]